MPSLTRIRATDDNKLEKIGRSDILSRAGSEAGSLAADPNLSASIEALPTSLSQSRLDTVTLHVPGDEGTA
jgi:hypothetical protein